MPAIRTHLFGWMPSGEGSEEVDLPQNPQGIYRIRAFNLSETNSIGNSSSTAKSSPTFVHTFSPAPTSSPSPEPTSPTSSSDQCCKRNRRDPSWVARPRNPFIIFRCEYSREHARDGNRVKRAAGVHGEKTLSKKAAEAWHQLSPEVKSHFKMLADQERDEHARQNPDYRFRPIKRPPSKRRKPGKHAGGPTFGRSRQRGKIPAAVPIREEEVRVPSPKLQLPPITPAQQKGDPCVKAVRCRSSSVSLPTNPLSQQPAPWESVDLQMIEMKRSKSLIERPPTMHPDFLPLQSPHASMTWTSLPEPSNLSSFDEFPFDLRNPHTPEFISNISSQGVAMLDSPLLPPFVTHNNPPVHYISPLTAVASSLAGWNDESTSAAAFKSSDSSTSLREWCTVGPAVNDTAQLSGFSAPKQSEALSQYPGYFSADIPCGSNLMEPRLERYRQPISSIIGAQCGLRSKQPMMEANAGDFYDELERAQALHEYGIGLMERVAVGSSSMGYPGADEESGSRTPLEFDISDFFPAL